MSTHEHSTDWLSTDTYNVCSEFEKGCINPSVTRLGFRPCSDPYCQSQFQSAERGFRVAVGHGTHPKPNIFTHDGEISFRAPAQEHIEEVQSGQSQKYFQVPAERHEPIQGAQPVDHGGQTAQEAHVDPSRSAGSRLTAENLSILSRGTRSGYHDPSSQVTGNFQNPGEMSRSVQVACDTYKPPSTSARPTRRGSFKGNYFEHEYPGY
ncbi:uncharacterized protein I303_100935 [Kwoniella dejecticola CBS 10117]|uniref:Uncharacterized protein n=1 Tax=Kwoniella dejecticola CBS 10117 TaxID=1296121 RepID=A0A1A6AGC3_9TREE|nr:uncharacterized protein I303_00939 [Kwoniella dejecticola CBS 10117]OBR89117.1 hypothetical protein I303_00939 [Kwoniella dejecticola CBS 10117]